MNAMPFGVAFSLFAAALVLVAAIWHAVHPDSNWCRKSFLWGGFVWVALYNVILEWPVIGDRTHRTFDDLIHLGDGIQPDWWNPEWSPWVLWGALVLAGVLFARFVLHVKPPWQWGKNKGAKGGRGSALPAGAR